MRLIYTKFCAVIAAVFYESISGSSISGQAYTLTDPTDGLNEASDERGRTAPRFHISLISRTFWGRKPLVMQTLPCFAAILPGTRTEVVYVLDAEPADYEMGAEINAFFHNLGLGHYVRVLFEKMPPCSGVMFTGDLEDGGSVGKDRSQRSNFLFDNYTQSPIIGHFDSEVCFTAPVTESYFVRDGRIQVPSLLDGDMWGVDAVALNFPTPLDVMRPNVFPMLMWAKDLSRVREALITRYFGNRSLAKIREVAPYHCEYETGFDAAFSTITNSGPSKTTPRHGFSQFNIIYNYFLHFIPEKYEFLTWTSAHNEYASSLQMNYPDSRITAAPESGIDFFVVGMNTNGQEAKHSTAVLDVGRNCCFLHPALNSSCVACGILTSYLNDDTREGKLISGRCVAKPFQDPCTFSFFRETSNEFASPEGKVRLRAAATECGRQAVESAAHFRLDLPRSELRVGCAL